MIKLREIYTVLFPEEEQESQVWDLDVQTIKEVQNSLYTSLLLLTTPWRAFILQSKFSLEFNPRVPYFGRAEERKAIADASVFVLQKLLEMDADDERKQEFLQKVNQAVISMSFPPFTPKQKDMYSVG